MQNATTQPVTPRRPCSICAGQTRNAEAEFCTPCERRLDAAIRQLSEGGVGSTVVVPRRVN